MAKRIVAQEPWVAPDFVPETFGRLTTVSSKYIPENSKHSLVDCVCICGTIRAYGSRYLKSGATKSCGCLKRGRLLTPGKSKTPEYDAWLGMFRRCGGQKPKDFAYYKGAGVTVFCDWDGSGGFERWLAHMGLRPSNKHSIDRFPNPNGNYEPGNVRWATAKEQMNNTRVNIILEHEGKTQTLSQWSEDIGINASVLYKRHYAGWCPEKILSTPLRVRK